MNYLMGRASEQIKEEIQQIYDAIHALYASAISIDNAGYQLLERRLEELGKELKQYEE
jgi:hypothetical protein